jgi:proteasome lid subunit RPN8/RPN11
MTPLRHKSSLTAIILTSQQIQRLISLAKDSLPKESCALLAGNQSETKTHVIDLILMKNSKLSTTSFSIDPQELINAYKNAQKLSMEIVGIFHSHPSGVQPSSTDRKFMELNPIIWLIYSTSLNKYKAYVLNEETNEIQQVRIIMV